MYIFTNLGDYDSIASWFDLRSGGLVAYGADEIRRIAGFDACSNSNAFGFGLGLLAPQEDSFDPFRRHRGPHARIGPDVDARRLLPLRL